MNLVAAVLALLDGKPLTPWPFPGSLWTPPPLPVRSNDGEPLHDL